MSICGKNFNIAMFSDTVNVINVELYMMVVLVELYNYIFLPFSVTLVVFEGHSSVRQFYQKIL